MVKKNGVEIGKRIMKKMVEKERNWKGMVEKCINIVIEKRKKMLNERKKEELDDGMIKRIVKMRREENGKIIIEKKDYNVGRESDLDNRMKKELI